MVGSVQLLTLDDLVTDLAERLVWEVCHVLATDDPDFHFARVGNHREQGPHVVKLITDLVDLVVGHSWRVVPIECPVTPQQPLSFVVQVKWDENTGPKTVSCSQLLEDHLVRVEYLVTDLLPILVDSNASILE